MHLYMYSYFTSINSNRMLIHNDAELRIDARDFLNVHICLGQPEIL